MPLLGVDVGSTRVHVAIAHEGQALSVAAVDGQACFPSVIGLSHGSVVVGEPARAHFFVAPDEVVFGPGRYLGGAPVQLGHARYAADELVARLLEQAVAAGLAVTGAPIDGAALSRPAGSTREARRALTAAAQRAGLNLVRTEVATTLAAVAQRCERGPIGLVAFVDVGGWKVEVTVASLEMGMVRALGRSMNGNVGGEWLDLSLVTTFARHVAADRPERLLGDRVCYEMLREQCEALRVQLSGEPTAAVTLPFLMPLLGTQAPPVWQLDRRQLETLARPLLDAIPAVCTAALANAALAARDIGEAFVLGGLAHMPAVRDAVGSFFGKLARGRGDVDGLAARGAALVAAAT